MKVIFGVRGSGKTTALINESAETGYYIVTRNHETAMMIMNAARSLNKDIPFPLTYQEFIRHHFYSKGVGGILIDELDDFLNHLGVDCEVKTVAFTPTIITKLNIPKEYAEQAKILSSALPEEEKVKLLGGDWDVE